ncbi:MAG: hypothetical protein BWY17_03298 [Deltaproteobacteria bacterium ADurb.Bin207]|nr:MAG: hypothetical protein BWY17_03298 [Deltaproteobacteria bacterium ADurb.Bin207]
MSALAAASELQVVYAVVQAVSSSAVQTLPESSSSLQPRKAKAHATKNRLEYFIIAAIYLTISRKQDRKYLGRKMFEQRLCPG